MQSAGLQDIYQSLRNGDGWYAPQRVLSMDRTVMLPVVTSDELGIYFALLDELGAQADIWYAERTTTDEAFADATRVPELSTTQSEVPTWLSPDDCRLIVDRGDSWTTLAVILAERWPEEP